MTSSRILVDGPPDLLGNELQDDAPGLLGDGPAELQTDLVAQKFAVQRRLKVRSVQAYIII